MHGGDSIDFLGPENLPENVPQNLPENLPQSVLSEIFLQLIHAYEEMKYFGGNLLMNQDAPVSTEKVFSFQYSLGRFW